MHKGRSHKTALSPRQGEVEGNLTAGVLNSAPQSYGEDVVCERELLDVLGSEDHMLPTLAGDGGQMGADVVGRQKSGRHSLGDGDGTDDGRVEVLVVLGPQCRGGNQDWSELTHVGVPETPESRPTVGGVGEDCGVRRHDWDHARGAVKSATQARQLRAVRCAGASRWAPHVLTFALVVFLVVAGVGD